MTTQESRILTIVHHHGRPVVLPRRIRLTLREGPASVEITGSAVDPAWRQTADTACRAALELVGAGDAGTHITLDPGPPLTGSSAGVTLGLLTLLALLEVDDTPPFFATGHLDSDGFLQGGAAIHQKARAVEKWTRQGAVRGRPLIAPPLWLHPDTDIPHVRTCTDLASALPHIAPQEYDRIRDRHLDLARRPVDQIEWPSGDWLHVRGPGTPTVPVPPGVTLLTSPMASGSGQGALHAIVGRGPLRLWATWIPSPHAGPDTGHRLVHSVHAAHHVALVARLKEP